ncbi:hypothetical protein HDU82_004370 [Entophlyctis luteolus]|nr:hypothetical protein HDU82_004370 [Entophlyctis luteolus]
MSVEQMTANAKLAIWSPGRADKGSNSQNYSQQSFTWPSLRRGKTLPKPTVVATEAFSSFPNDGSRDGDYLGPVMVLPSDWKMDPVPDEGGGAQIRNPIAATVGDGALSTVPYEGPTSLRQARRGSRLPQVGSGETNSPPSAKVNSAITREAVIEVEDEKQIPPIADGIGKNQFRTTEKDRVKQGNSMLNTYRAEKEEVSENRGIDNLEISEDYAIQKNTATPAFSEMSRAVVDIGATDLNILLSLLRSMECDIYAIDLSNDDLSQGDLNLLIEALKGNTSVTRVSVGEPSPTENAVEIVRELLLVNHSILEFKVGATTFSRSKTGEIIESEHSVSIDAEKASIAVPIRQTSIPLSHLEEDYFEGEASGKEKEGPAKESFQEMRCSVIDLGDCSLSGLIELLNKRDCDISVLDLSEDELLPVDVVLIAKAIVTNTSLKRLVFAEEHVTDRSIRRALEFALSVNKSLDELQIGTRLFVRNPQGVMSLQLSVNAEFQSNATEKDVGADLIVPSVVQEDLRQQLSSPQPTQPISAVAPLTNLSSFGSLPPTIAKALPQRATPVPSDGSCFPNTNANSGSLQVTVNDQQKLLLDQIQTNQQFWQNQERSLSAHSRKVSSSSVGSDSESTGGLAPSDSISNYEPPNPVADFWSKVFAVRPTFKHQKPSPWIVKTKTEVTLHLGQLRAAAKKSALKGDTKKSGKSAIEFCKFCIQDTFALDPNDRHEVLNECFDLLKKLCFQGSAEAQYLLGKSYYQDDNYESAYVLFYNAAIQSHGPACSKVAIMISNGRGVEKNDQIAVGFLNKGVFVGDIESAYRLGSAYTHGKLGLAVNYVEAVRLLNECVKVSDSRSEFRPRALYEISHIYETGSEEIPKNAAIALSALNDSAKGGYLPAITKIATCYLQGKLGLKPNESKAKGLLQTAADLGDKKASILLQSMTL